MRKFEDVVEKVIAKLEAVETMKLLNDEGVRTLEAYKKLLDLVPFYDDLRKFAEDEDVKEIFDEYKDCDKVLSAKRYLKK